MCVCAVGHSCFASRVYAHDSLVLSSKTAAQKQNTHRGGGPTFEIGEFPSDPCRTSALLPGALKVWWSRSRVLGRGPGDVIEVGIGMQSSVRIEQPLPGAHSPRQVRVLRGGRCTIRKPCWRLVSPNPPCTCDCATSNTQAPGQPRLTRRPGRPLSAGNNRQAVRYLRTTRALPPVVHTAHTSSCP